MQIVLCYNPLRDGRSHTLYRTKCTRQRNRATRKDSPHGHVLSAVYRLNFYLLTCARRSDYCAEIPELVQAGDCAFVQDDCFRGEFAFIGSCVGQVSCASFINDLQQTSENIRQNCYLAAGDVLGC
jgi:hypothetical protein